MKTTYIVQSLKEEKKDERTIIVANTPLQFNMEREAISRVERDAELFIRNTNNKNPVASKSKSRYTSLHGRQCSALAVL